MHVKTCLAIGAQKRTATSSPAVGRSSWERLGDTLKYAPTYNGPTPLLQESVACIGFQATERDFS